MQKKKSEIIWNPVFILPNAFTLIDIFDLSSASRCLIAITRNSLDTIISDDIRKNIDSSSLPNKIIVITMSNLSAIGSRNSPNDVV